MKKMRMESKIILTFLLMFAAAFIINVLYGIISLNGDFFTFETILKAVIAAMTYLLYIWILTIEHKLLTILGLTGITLFVIFAEFYSLENINWCWKDTVMLFYYLTSVFFAIKHSKKLLKEETQASFNNGSTLKDDVDPKEEIK